MGCLKLTYKPIFEPRTHGSMPSREAKVVQMFISVDPLAEETMEPYSYTGNSPIMFTDPTGMSKDGIEHDYKMNSEGDITLVRETDDDFDRILSTNNRGDVRKKGDGLLGVLVPKSEREEEVIAVDNIAKGILKDGINFKQNNNVIEVNGVNPDGSSQPTESQFQDFIVDYTKFSRVEVSGYGLGNSLNSNDVSAYLIEAHKDNGPKESKSARFNGNTRIPRSYLGGYLGKSIYAKHHYHSHPDNSLSSEDDKRNAGYKSIPHFIYSKKYNQQYNERGVFKTTTR